MSNAAAGLDEIDYEALGVLGDYLLSVRDRGFSARTVWEKYHRLTDIAEHVGQPLHLAPEPAVRAWWRGLARRGLEDSTRGTYLSHARTWWRWVVREGHRPDDPTARIDPPRRRRGLPRDVDVPQALTAVQGTQGRAWVATQLALRLGMRCCEICAVHARRDVRHRDDGPVLRVTGKGQRGRVLPIPRELVPAFTEAARTTTGWLFPSPRNPLGHWSADHTSAVIAQALRSRGLDATAHQLRHTAGGAYLALTGDLAAVQEYLGHESITSTQIYARAAGPSREAIEALFGHPA